MNERPPPPADNSQDPPPTRAGAGRWGRLAFAVLTAACFAYLYYRIDGAAAREGLDVLEYMGAVFARVNWWAWLALMMAYSLFYFAIDTLVVAKALTWFLVRIPYRDILPIRASAYIISIFNEQVGKGAMAYYLNRRDGIPGWEVGSVMLFIMFCEFFYLLTWASIGYLFRGDELPAAFALVPYFALAGGAFLILWILFFQGAWWPNARLRNHRALHAFRQARFRHYGAFFLLRSPALLAAVFVYSLALRLFGVEMSALALLPYLPIIFFAATVPTPMRAAAITFWVVLFPDNEGALAAFGFVQHNFFILFNALIGLAFWRRAGRELFGN